MTVSLEIEGLYCAACVGRAERVLARLPGVDHAEVNLAANTLSLDGSTDPATLHSALQKAGYGLRPATMALGVEGLDDAAAEARARAALSGLAQVIGVDANLASGTLVLRVWSGPGLADRAIAALAQAGFAAHPLGAGAPDRLAQEEAAMRRRFVIALGLTLPVFISEMGGHMVPAFHHWLHNAFGMGLIWTMQAVLTTAVIFGPGLVFLRRGLPALARLAPDMNSLVALGTLSAWAYSMVVLLAPAVLPDNARAVYFEAAAVIVTLILMGRWLEARARGRSGAAIRALVELQPAEALVETPEGVETRPLSALRPGDVLRILPGARVPSDARVIDGQSHVDESMLTGEPLPVLKGPNDTLTGGTVNGAGALRAEVTRVGADTTLARILDMVTQAQAGKLPIQALVDRVTAVFVPVVMAVALGAVLVWLALGPSLTHALVAGVSVLIVACPCAMGLATPTSILVGTGRAAQQGVLFRKGEALQRLAGVRGVAFDKTGTLTEGRPALTDLVGAADILPQIAALEQFSEHPVARAILTAAAGQTLPPVTGFAAHPGMGVEGDVGGQQILLGAARFMAARGLDLAGFDADPMAAQGKTVLFAARDGQVVAMIAVSDPIKPTAHEAVQGLQAMGVQVAMISGDAPATAQAVAADLRITTVIAGVLPGGKVDALNGLPGFAFVGDGINDAPALAAAEVGLAMGSGTDIAIESADVVLAGGDPAAVLRALRIARATLRNIKQNLFWAFAYNAALVPVAAGVLYPGFGVQMSPMLAAGAMALSSVFVLSNALRLRRA
jgi:P-type Cu+ transporter